MIQNIDFLPDSYHQCRQRRQKNRWRQMICIVFLAIVAAGMLGQRQARGRLEADRDRLRSQAAELTAKLDSPEELKKQIAQLDGRADLVAHLRLRVPTTRMLAAVTESRPSFVTLTEFRTNYEKLPITTAKSPTKAKPAAPADKPPELLDLERLRRQAAETGLFVSVSGLAPDDVAISQYLAALQETAVFEDVQLMYTDQHLYRGHTMRRFALKLRVRTPLKEQGKQEQAQRAGFIPGHPDSLAV